MKICVKCILKQICVKCILKQIDNIYMYLHSLSQNMQKLQQ